jgi:hypothetical protein
MNFGASQSRHNEVVEKHLARGSAETLVNNPVIQSPCYYQTLEQPGMKHSLGRLKEGIPSCPPMAALEASLEGKKDHP